MPVLCTLFKSSETALDNPDCVSRALAIRLRVRRRGSAQRHRRAIPGSKPGLEPSAGIASRGHVSGYLLDISAIEYVEMEVKSWEFKRLDNFDKSK